MRQLNLTLKEIDEYIVEPMCYEGRVVTPKEYSKHLFMRYLRNICNVERYFIRGKRTGYRVTYKHNSNIILPFGSLYVLMELYKTSVMEHNPKKNFGTLFLDLLDRGYDFKILEDMLKIEELLEEDSDNDNHSR